MGLLYKSLQKGMTQEQEDIFNVSNPQLANMLGIGLSAASGVVVNEKTAMRLSAVYAAIQLLAKVMAMTPLILYKDRGIGNKESGKDRKPDHPLYHVLKNNAYNNMPSFQLKECMMYGSLINGNAYAYIHKNRIGQCVGLQYIQHNYVQIDTSTGEKRYIVTINGKTMIYRDDEILHVPGMGYDGIRGLSPIDVARETIGKGLAVQEFGSRFFANGANFHGVFKHPMVLSEEGHGTLKKDLEEKYAGIGNSNKTILLEEGMEFTPISIPPEQSQFLETMKFSVSDIARIYGVPPHMIGDLEKATFSNIESQDINFVKYSMLPWYTRYEQFINISCLTEAERKQGYFTEFLADNILRGDSKARAEVHHAMRQDGVINADEWRESENRNPIPGGLGKAYLVNGNMIPVQTAIDQKPKNNSGGSNETI